MPKTASSQKQQRENTPYKQKYRKEWEHESVFKGWLTKAPENSQNKGAYCKVCLTLLTAQRKILLDHGQTQKHAAAMERQKEVFTLPKIDNFVKPVLTESRKVAELKLAFFTAEHTSIKTIDHLSVVIKSLDHESAVLKEIQLHRTKCTALIKNSLSPCILQELLDDVGDSFYSLIVDESTAIDEMESGTSDAIADAILTQLKIDKLSTDKLLGLGVDGASVNVGKKHSLTTNLKKVNPCITVIKCICHSLHLAAEKACECLPRHLDYMIRESHNWFSHSTKRQLEYKDIYILITGNKKGPNKLVRLSDTRWLVREGAIFIVLDQWDPLKLLFQMAESKEKDFVALQLASMYKSDENKLYLTFIYSILKPVIALNKSFQSDRADPIQLFGELNDLFYSILQKIVVPTQLEKVSRSKISGFEFSRYLMSYDCINFGYDFNKMSGSIEKETLKNMKIRCRDFLIQLAHELQDRVPENIHILEKVSLFSQENASKQIKSDIQEIAEHFQHVCVDIDETIRQWNLLHRVEIRPQNSAVDYWLEISKIKNADGSKKFQNICNLALALLSLPFSNASVERVFSVVNIVKDKLRNKLEVAMVEAILHVRCTSQIDCTEFKPTPAMLKLFKSEKLYKKVTESDIDVLDIFPTE